MMRARREGRAPEEAMYYQVAQREAAKIPAHSLFLLVKRDIARAAAAKKG
jgi:hypothetical protein